MKILMINAVCGTGSTGRICTELAELLQSHGHTVKIAYGRGTVAPQYEQFAHRIGSELGVRLNGICARFLDNEGFAARRATKKFLHWVEKFDPDMIHLHNLHGYYLNLPLLFRYLKRSGKKVIWTLHDCWSFTGHCAYYSAADCDRWQTQCRTCPQKHAYPKSLLLSNAKGNFEKKRKLFTGLQDMTLVTPSYWLAQQVSQSFLREYPVKVIYNGVDLKLFRPMESDFRKQHGLENAKILLGVANVWETRKGLNDFVRLSQLLSADYKIILVGLSQQQISALPKQIMGISRTDNLQQLIELYSTADVYINPSVEETMGMTTLEALACGTPVITYNRTAVPEVADETCGISVDCRPEEILAALDRLQATPEACLRRAKAFAKDEKYAQYLALYQ